MDLSGFRHQLVPNTDHRCLWIDSSFIDAFGRNMAPPATSQSQMTTQQRPQAGTKLCQGVQGLSVKTETPPVSTEPRIQGHLPHVIRPKQGL
jgi:hypothetical protein